MNTINTIKVKKCADYVRYLSLECIERAKSGHPGLPLGCADLGVLLYRYVLTYDPQAPSWPNRDRFILSAGHGSMLLYSLLHLTGYDFSLEDLAAFRQLGSKTPGHPEYDVSLGIETTTGPLGQGFANAVGCALEGKMLARQFNDGAGGSVGDLFDYTVFTLMGDGCTMEGINYEAASMAGHLGLDNLVAIYDSNDITIDGNTNITFTEDTVRRFEAQGWHVEQADLRDTENIPRVTEQLLRLKALKGKPALLVVKTFIGEGLDSKKNGSDIHGAPAGISEMAYFVQNSAMRGMFEAKYGADAVADPARLTEILETRLKQKASEPLLQSADCPEFMREHLEDARAAHSAWTQKLEAHRQKYPGQYDKLMSFNFSDSLGRALLNYRYFKEGETASAVATRGVSGKVLNLCADSLPHFVGGTADLAGSTKGQLKGPGEKSVRYIGRDDFSARNIAFGVREHAMGAIGNGLALGNVSIPFTSTFFTFFDYMKPAVRLAALMKLNHLFLFSHDSIYVGEDGPTHQPIEHLNALRLIPGLHTFRPANDVETAFAFYYFLKRMAEGSGGPVAVITSRQNIPATMFGRPETASEDDRKALYRQFETGAYVFYETACTGSSCGCTDTQPDVVLCASGSEVSTAMEAATLLETEKNKTVRVVSIPCLELFSRAGAQYIDGLLGGPHTPVVMVEAASHRGMKLFYDRRIALVDIDEFGTSAPGGQVAEHFNFTGRALYNCALEHLGSVDKVSKN